VTVGAVAVTVTVETVGGWCGFPAQGGGPPANAKPATASAAIDAARTSLRARDVVM
jgi:hypothetical protein